MIQFIALSVVVIVCLVLLVMAFRRKKCGSKAKAPQSNAPRRSSDSRAQQNEPNTQLYVGNLSYRASDDDVSEFFGSFGAIETIRVIKDRRTGRSKGFAFVTFAKIKSATAALEAHGQDFSGRSLIVRYAKPSND